MSQQKIFFEIEFKGSKELFDQIDLLRLKIQQVNESLKGTSIDGLSSQLKAEFERAKKVVDTFNKVSGGKGADSSTNIQSPVNTKPVEIPLKFKLDGDQDIIKQFVEVEQRIKALKDEGKVALKLGDSERLVEIKQEVEGLTIARSKLNKEIKEGSKNNEEFPTGSIQDLTQKVRILAKEYNLLSEEEREATDRGKDLGKQLGEARVKLNQAKLAVNDYTSNIGNYEGATNNLYLKIKALATATANGNKEVIASLQGDIKAIRIATEKDIDALLKDYQKLSAQEKNSSKGRDKLTLISQAQSQLGGIDKAVGDLDSKVNPLKAKFLSIGDVVTGGLITGGITAAASIAASAVGSVFELNSRLSDLKADIAKTSGLEAKDVDDLANSLEGLDTRTTLDELLKIAAIGGQLGISTAEGLQKFTESVDILNSALGESFGGNVDVVTEKVGKLSNVLFGTTTDGEEVAKRMLAIGNALNVLAAEGQASEGVIVDFANRIGGILTPLKATQGQVLGLSAAMDELALNPERGATAMVTIINKLGSELPNFAKALNLSEKDLKNAFNADPIKAFQIVAKQAFDVSGGSSTELLKKLDELGISGVGATEVFLKLANNGELVSKRIDTATSSLSNYNSLSDEASKKNEDLQGSWQRLKNKLSEFAASPAVESFLKGVISFTSIAIDEIDKLFGKFVGLGYAINDIFKRDFDFTSFKKFEAEQIKKRLLANTSNGDKSLVIDQSKNTLQDAEDAKKQAAAAAKAEAEAKKQAIAEAEAAKKKAAKEKLENEKKEREKLDKELEDQYRRLNELRRSIKQLASENIDNVFDKQIIDATNRTADELAKLEENRKKVQDKIKGQKGKETKLDKDELDYIDQQTKQIKDKLNKQTLEINQKRREAFEQQQDQLRKNRDEANKILLNTQVTGLSERLGNIKTGAEDKIQTIKLDYEINKEKLDDQLKAGLLSQKEYEAQINSLEISSKSEQEAIIKERNKRILAIYDEYLLLRKGQIETERDIAISDLGIEESKALESVDEKLKRGEIESVSKANEAKDAIEQLYAQKRIAINENAANEISKLNKDSAKEKKSLLEDDLKATKETEEAKTKEEKLELEKRKANRKELIETLKTAAFDLAQQTSDLLFDNEKSRLEKQKEAGLAALEEEYAKKIEFAQGNTLEIAKLEKERDEKRKKLEKEAFEQNKRVQINQAIANGALAILKAFASLDPISAAIASIGIAAQTAFQIARIKSTKYERGGLLKGKKHIQGGINLGFGQEGEDGEAIINAESTKKHYKLLSAINTDGGNGDPLPGLQSFSNPIFSQRPAIYDRIVPSNPQQYQSNSTVSVSISQKDMDMISEKVRLGIVEGTKYVETSRSKIESFRKNNSY